MNTTPKGDGPKEGLKRRIVLLTALVATLMIPVVLFFGYDLLRARLLPCATTAEQVGVELTTKIKLAGIEGEVHLGKENLWELSERAQLLALDLKSCCQLLSGGRDNTSAFLQCKASARRYETDIENVISHVRAAVAAETAQLTDKLSEATRGIAEAVTAARTTSETFSGRVREIRKEQAIVQLEALPPQHIEVEAQEREPNDDVLTTNVVKLGAWITGAIGHPRDDDFYTFTLPDGPRDIFRVELENRSTTLEPELHHYDSRKSHTRGLSNGTAGADLSYEFVAEPGSRHHLQVRNDDRATTGAYLLRIAPRNAYDAFEPNDTVLQAKPIRTGEAVMAGVMDGLDDDYFVIETGTDGGNLSIALENRSTTLEPELYVYDGNKQRLRGWSNGTPGADLSGMITATPGARYYVQVRNDDRFTAGDYTLTVDIE